MSTYDMLNKYKFHFCFEMNKRKMEISEMLIKTGLC